MLSSSTVGKLKMFLIIDLLIVGVVGGVYFYLQDEGVIPGPIRPATFVFSDLVLSNSETFVGQPIQVFVNVTNTGDLEGDITVELKINETLEDSVNVTLAGLNSWETVEFTVIKTKPGAYSVKIGDLSASFLLTEAPPNISKIVLSMIRTSPAYEVWPNEPMTIMATTKNPSSKADSLIVTFSVDGVSKETKIVELAAGATGQVEFTVVTDKVGTHNVKLNSLSGTFQVVPEGHHTLVLTRSGGGGIPLPFTLNGEVHEAHVYSAVLPEGKYSVTVPTVFDVGTGVLGFSHWNSDTKGATVTFTLDRRMTWVANYIVLSGQASCPSLYIWNGTGYSYVTDVSNSGWLGYIGYINADGEIVFSGGNPYDYVKLDKDVLAIKEGYFDIVLSQQWDELFYLDSASLLVVDHPVGTDVYTSMTNYLNKGYTGQIYTTNTGTLLAPISAVNEKGENVLAAILLQDNNFTPGINGNDSPAWNNITQNQLTINLGDLSEAEQIKLVITGMVDWGPADVYYDWISQFQTAATAGLITDNTPITPMSKMEILTTNGTWIEAPQDRQIPIPSDYTARTFTVNITDLFPKDTKDYIIRFTNFWNVTYDYIGIDTTNQQDTILTTIKPTYAELGQFWETTPSKSTGNFTQYGNVTTLLQETDDLFVIGRQCDKINIQFNTENLPPPQENMERDYFFIVACWFKDPPDAWGYGYTFTVEPLPFLNMTGYPYNTNKENYPYTNNDTYNTYLNQYNTRTIP